MNGIELIAAERKRQVESEGWTPEHDDQHDSDEMAMAAAVYAMTPHWRKQSIGTYPFGSSRKEIR